MSVIQMHGIVGVDIVASEFAKELNSMEGDVFLDLNSPGGFITDGIAMLNAVREYKKGKVTARVSFAASMMTQIALAADEVQAYDNSVFMIHNAIGVAAGDYRDMERKGKALRAMSNMLSNIYVRKTGKSREDILTMMDNETYLYGNEIVDQGFADALLNTEENALDRDSAIATSMEMMARANTAMQDENLTADKLENALKSCGLECDLNGPTTFKDLDIVDQSWDSAAAIRRVRAFLNAEDKPNARYKEAFFWYNSSEAGNFGAYKLPFVDVVDGKLVANIRGVYAANGSMAGARGNRVDIPAADRSRVQSHIDRYREKWLGQKDSGGVVEPPTNNNPKGAEKMTLDELKAQHPDVYALAVNEGVEKERKRVKAHITMGEAAKATDVALKHIKEHIKDGAELDMEVNAEYQAAAIKSHAIEARGEEAPGGVTPPAVTPDAEDEAIAKELRALAGVEE